MTDKQIIIDGCDVSECPNFTFNKIEPNDSICISEQSAMCINNKDCLYKKWKRKEQECEEKQKIAQDAISKLCAEKSTLYNKLDQLKAKNEQLKKEIRLYDCIDKWGTEQCRCACRCLGNEFCDDADKKINKLKQALTEIKQLLEDALDTDKTNAEQSFDNIHKAIKLCEVLDE